MPSEFDLLVDVIHAQSMDNWKGRNAAALQELFGTRYARRAEASVTLRAPDMGGSDANVPYSAYIHPANPTGGAYGGMSFVIFPVEDAPCLVGMVIGTQGLSPDETILGRPGHARKMQAVVAWLNRTYGEGTNVAWAKQDPTRTDITVPGRLLQDWSAYDRVFKRYGQVLYAIYRPTANRQGTLAAVTSMLDILFEERGQEILKASREKADQVRASWFAHMMPKTEPGTVTDLLAQRRFVILQGPPGTGKTRMARQLLKEHYAGNGRTLQFHPGTTYENFIGGLAPLTSSGDGLGFRFAPKPGFLMEAAAQARSTNQPYLLHIDEINRADLGKILGEAIYLLEPKPESPRTVDLPYDFGEPFHHQFALPDNLHILGTMNSADRSIAIVDVAVRRRFGFLSLWPDLDVVQRDGSPNTQKAFQDLVSIFVEHAPDEAFALLPGHSYFPEKDDARAPFRLRATLAPLLLEYLAQGYVAGFAEQIRGYLQWLESL